MQTTRDIIAKDGLKGLWRGTAPSLLRYALTLRHHLIRLA